MSLPLIQLQENMFFYSFYLFVEQGIFSCNILRLLNITDQIPH